MKITFAQVQSLAPGMNDEYEAAFRSSGVNDILTKYKIAANGLRLAHFFAQILEETGGFKIKVESLWYSPSRLMAVWPRRFLTLQIAEQYAHNEEKLGNYVYGGRLGNVNPGDGFRYRGRGLLQITGRAAYAKYGDDLSVDLESNPDLAFNRDHCLEIAAAEWAASGHNGKSCNQLADDDDIVGVTYAINGGQTGIEDRRYWLTKTKAVWGRSTPTTASDLMSSRATANLEAALTLAPDAEARAATPAPDSGTAGSFGPRAASIALAEWRKFGEQTYDISGHATHIGHKEGETPYYQYVGEYWKYGVNNDTLTGLDHSVPWSAAFISWVMRTAGAGDRFNYSPQHSVYIFRAIKDLLQGKPQAGYYCYQLREWKPQVGDLVCWARREGIDYQHQNGGDYPGHCDVVVEVGADQVQVVGGNVGDSVTKRPLALNAGGFLQAVNQGGENLFGIMRCRL
jgi:predicted chitinase